MWFEFVAAPLSLLTDIILSALNFPYFHEQKENFMENEGFTMALRL
jgi:hypothetical protein